LCAFIAAGDNAMELKVWGRHDQWAVESLGRHT
jgi:hypothetical protein